MTKLLANIAATVSAAFAAFYPLTGSAKQALFGAAVTALANLFGLAQQPPKRRHRPHTRPRLK